MRVDTLPHTYLSSRIDNFVQLIGQTLSYIWLALLFVIVINVLMRYLFSEGRIELEELQWHLYSVGFLLGIGGVVTFKNGKIDQFLNQIDIKHIVLETDAPYLSPAPHRGKRNQSSYLSLIASKVSALYAISEAQVAEITTANAAAIFKI